MYIALVHVHVKAESVDAFKDLIRTNHLGSIQEPGCLRFDVAQSVEDPRRFVLWEWYADEDAAAFHKTTPHYLDFKAASSAMMAEERVTVRYHGLFPERAAMSA